MSNVVNNPEELDGFANQLQHYLETLAEETGRISGAFSQMGNVWQDEKYAQFEEAFQALVSEMNAFQDRAEEHIPHLHKMAEVLREYQRV